MCVNVELQYWELKLELVSNQCLSLPNSDLSLPNSDLSLPNWAVIVLYFRHCALLVDASVMKSWLGH